MKWRHCCWRNGRECLGRSLFRICSLWRDTQWKPESWMGWTKRTKCLLSSRERIDSLSCALRPDAYQVFGILPASVRIRHGPVMSPCIRPQTGLPLKRTSLVDVVFCILDHTGAEAGAVPAGPGKWKLAKDNIDYPPSISLAAGGQGNGVPFNWPQAAMKWRAVVDVVFCILDHTGAEAGAVPAGPGKWKLAKKHLSS